MYIQLQVKTEVVCIEEEENRDSLLLHGRHVPRDEESKKRNKNMMRVRSKKE